MKMDKILEISVLMAVSVVLITSFASAQSIYKISERKQLTTDPYYNRNPSFFKTNDGTWYLFFVKSRTIYNGYGCDESGGPMNCDQDNYDVYYIKSTDYGETWSQQIRVDECSIGRRGMAAFQDNTGKIWVFVSAPAPGLDDGIYYCISTDGGNTWSEPIWTGYAGSHVDALQTDSGRILIFYENEGVKAIYTDDYGATWSSEITVDGRSGMGIPKAMEDISGRIHIVYANWKGLDGVPETGDEGAYYRSVSTNDGITWTYKGIIADIPNTISCDPVLYQDSNGLFWLFYAPWESIDNSQWIEFKTSTNINTWSEPIGLTSGGYGSNYWWDMWPEVSEGSDIMIFFTSEQSSNGNDRIDGNIWMFRLKDRIKALEEDINKLQEDDQEKWDAIHSLEEITLGLDNWKVSIENEISAIWIKLEEIQKFVKSVIDCAFATFSPFHNCLMGEQPEIWEDHCPNGICEPTKGETPISCPSDCFEQPPSGELFIMKGWKVICPEIFQSGEIIYEIDQCRAELFRYGHSISNRTLQPNEKYQVNYNAGFELKLYGIPSAS